MNFGTQWLLIAAVASVGVLHTLVPDHWAPITVLARQRGWSRRETARVALQAGAGHVISTLAIALLVWIAGVAAAKRFGTVIDMVASIALVGFGMWVAFSAWRELRPHSTHLHRHGGETVAHSHDHRIRSISDTNEKRGSRTALLLILGSSPMVEGIPVFFAAGRYGVGVIAAMAAVFAASTIATYVLLCVASTFALRRIRLGALERYGEVLSGIAIAVVGLAFWLGSGK